MISARLISVACVILSSWSSGMVSDYLLLNDVRWINKISSIAEHQFSPVFFCSGSQFSSAIDPRALINIQANPFVKCYRGIKVAIMKGQKTTLVGGFERCHCLCRPPMVCLMKVLFIHCLPSRQQIHMQFTLESTSFLVLFVHFLWRGLW